MSRPKKNGTSAMTFVCEPGAEARQVFLVGTFNGWDPRATRMVKRNGTFRKKMELPPGEHEYKFIVDGEWRTDPAAAAQAPNTMGSMNSVVRV